VAYQIIRPANGEVIQTFPNITDADLEAAVKPMPRQQLIQTRQQLTYAAAAIAVEAAVAKSREIAAPECIAVVDASGNLLAFASLMDLFPKPSARMRPEAP